MSDSAKYETTFGFEVEATEAEALDLRRQGLLVEAPETEETIEDPSTAAPVADGKAPAEPVEQGAFPGLPANEPGLGKTNDKKGASS